ncbi:alpha/beta hydrolase [Aliifodinibius sp. S!AR15-10]|uniref:alpha/beta fold hydrolase n=1 Tax=Aliifodinibius sp. S!AR15-10 TaxID=2950437 RepID=UPI00285B5E99|nr:alpha/beta hydrolase [Aliifodinibius sp. S!AR15-10]MDR8392327.1 alpha/beta hydrolase [Aliifodinibius sp. S!AR15-10]
MKTDTKLLAWHGWGFDRTCWEPWRDLVSDQYLMEIWDRGYWGNQHAVEADETSEPKVLFAHSFGLHMCPDEQLRSADLLVIFGGFREFHPAAAQFRRRSKLILNKMSRTLQEHPEQVLEEFMENAYKPDAPPSINGKECKPQKLLDDLQALNRSTLNIEPIKNAQKICILHGSSDSIVPKAKGRELYDIFQGQASYFEVKDAGHALPFTHMEQCWAFIKPELTEIF